MSEFEIVESPRSAGPAEGPQGGEPERDRRALIGIAIALVAVVSLLMLRSGGDDGSPSLAGQEAVPISAATTTSRTTSEDVLSVTTSTWVGFETLPNVDELLASFGDQVVFVGTSVDDPDQGPRVFASMIATGRAHPLPVDGQPLAVVDGWLLVRADNGIDAVDLNSETWDPVRILQDETGRVREVELLPGAVRFWGWGGADEPVNSTVLSIGSWEVIPTPEGAPKSALGHQVFWVEGVGTFAPAGDGYEKISGGRLVGHNRDYLVIETCSVGAGTCQLDWMDRPTLEIIEPVHVLPPTEYLDLAPTGGQVFFGQKIIDLVNGDGLVLNLNARWDRVLARTETAALVGTSGRAVLLDIESGNTQPAPGFHNYGFPAPISVRASDYPLLEAVING